MNSCPGVNLSVTHERGVFSVQAVRVFTSNPSALCPDLLRYEQISAADNMRGRVVRAFFWLMRVWPA